MDVAEGNIVTSPSVLTDSSFLHDEPLVSFDARARMATDAASELDV